MARTTSIDALASALESTPPDLRAHSSPDGAVTLLFTDIEDSTGMMERVGERRAYEIFRDHSAVVRALAEKHGGSVVKSQGDGFMIVFPSAHAGLHCALAMQRAVASRDAEPPLRIRIGLHTGFVIADAGDFFGRNVVLAARIADHASGGEVLVSGALREYTQTDPSFSFESLGELRFKGLLGEQAVYCVPWAA